MRTTVEYYLSGQSKQAKTFDTYKEAAAFMQALRLNPNCQSYGIVR